jgi:flagellar basal-body rod protein FlgG
LCCNRPSPSRSPRNRLRWRATAPCRSICRHHGATTTQQLGSLQLATFINPTGLESKGENLYVETTASGAPQQNTPGTNGTGTILQGYVETSNVNVVEEMVNMIQTQRAYEINSKAITTSDQMLQTVADVRTRS